MIGQPRERERFAHATVQYDWVTNNRGQRLRTFVTRPGTARGRVPVLFYVGWLSCDTMETPRADPADGFGMFMRRLIDESGYATLRMDKPGVGESEGECSTADFSSEMSGWQAAFDSLSKYDFIDVDRVFVVGLSNGGGFSPLVARDHPVRGFISLSAWGRTWYEHMLEHERRRLAGKRIPPADVNNAVKAFAQLYLLYLVDGLTPGDVLARHPEWKELWYDSPRGQYGRPAAFYQQLQALNLGAVWQKIAAPVLVMHGSADTVMSRADTEAIAAIVNDVHPGHARYLEIEGMAHDLTVNGRFHDPLIPTVLEWVRERVR